jgi:cellulose synthase/poly-beta-1,6-N-acetylglucosamine synthase-like glycosyltransferase
MMASILFGLLLAVTAIQILFWTMGIARLVAHRDIPVGKNELPVSLVICARNEAENLRKHLSLWLEQDYPDFEIILVDDSSTDDTPVILGEMQQQYPQRLRIVQHEKKKGDLPGKKAALLKGIEMARHPILLFTDADCAPASADWMKRMVAPFEAEQELVLGYGPLREHPGWVNRWSRYESVHTAITYLTAASWQLPYMGVGRNLAYLRNLAKKYNNTATHKDLPGGDDDLFVNGLPKGIKAALVIDAEAWCWSEAPSSWQEWYRQKTRHFQTGIRYQTGDKIRLAVQAFSHFSHYVLAFVLIGQFPLAVLSCLLVRAVVLGIAAARLWPRLGQSSLLPWFLVLDLLHLGYYLLFSPVIFGLQRSRKW